MKKSIFYTLVFSVALSFGCEKLEFKPKSELLTEEAIQSPEDLDRVLNSCYDVMANTINGRSQYYAELLSDNLARPLNNQDFIEVYNHNMLFFNGSIGSFYGEFYTTIFRVNSLLANYNQVDGVDDALVAKLENEGKFLRALCHFEVARLFAQPYNYTTDNSHAGIALVTELVRNPITRSTVEETYTQIEQDLLDVENLLPDDNDNGVYATKYATKALLARLYFMQQRYSEAVEKCDEIINSGKFSINSDVNRYTTAVSSEAIFYIESTNGNNRSGGFRDQFSSKADNPQLTISLEAFQLFTDTLDARKSWLLPEALGEEAQQIKINKFDADFFQIPYLNLTEILLTRAEALTYLEQRKDDAVSDVNQIIERAYGAGVNTVSSSLSFQGLQTRIQLERRKEFLGEGDRIFQIKRLGAEGSQQIDVRGDSWDCNGMILQFPISERSDVFELNPTGGC